jgi:hypothetical protein
LSCPWRGCSTAIANSRCSSWRLLYMLFSGCWRLLFMLARLVQVGCASAAVPVAVGASWTAQWRASLSPGSAWPAGGSGFRRPCRGRPPGRLPPRRRRCASTGPCGIVCASLSAVLLGRLKRTTAPAQVSQDGMNVDSPVCRGFVAWGEPRSNLRITATEL